MATYTYDEIVEALNKETTRIGEKMQGYLDEIAAGGMSKTREEEVLAGLNALADRLVVIGADPVEPIPPIEPEPPVVPAE